MAERQGDLLDDVTRFCDGVVAPGSVHALLHLERDRLFSGEMFADLLSNVPEMSEPDCWPLWAQKTAPSSTT